MFFKFFIQVSRSLCWMIREPTAQGAHKEEIYYHLFSWSSITQSLLKSTARSNSFWAGSFDSHLSRSQSSNVWILFTFSQNGNHWNELLYVSSPQHKSGDISRKIKTNKCTKICTFERLSNFKSLHKHISSIFRKNKHSLASRRFQQIPQTNSGLVQTNSPLWSTKA